MKKIAFFCIPAHGHTNPMLPVAEELVKNGNQVRFYYFKEFQQKIEATGAVFVSCSDYLTELTKEEEEGLKTVSTTEMTIQDIPSVWSTQINRGSVRRSIMRSLMTRILKL